MRTATEAQPNARQLHHHPPAGTSTPEPALHAWTMKLSETTGDRVPGNVRAPTRPNELCDQTEAKIRSLSLLAIPILLRGRSAPTTCCGCSAGRDARPPLGQAFAEYGRIPKTLHLLAVVDPVDDTYRRQMNRQPRPGLERRGALWDHPQHGRRRRPPARQLPGGARGAG